MNFIFLITLFSFAFPRVISGATFTLINRCHYTVWPGILGTSKLDSTGFELLPGGLRSINAQPGWSGRFWARTGCNFDPITGQGACTTADCGSNQVECNGAGAKPPATLAEFTVGSNGAQDFYDVSLVDGYNLPMMVQANGGTGGGCGSTGCITDLNRMCPNELRVGDGLACRSACEAFGKPEYCCSGEFGSPETCRPSPYSEIFKSACPRSYSYAYDDATSTFTCTGADYLITFCPTSSPSQKSTNSSTPVTNNGAPVIVDGSGPGSTSSPNWDNGGSWMPNFVMEGGSLKMIPNFITFVVLFLYYL
ncbi:thaumatin-like protein 1 [Impatiens glandulifera]|uniref:thaumatin-like protein 1 n=1 Tax=Impatiens glandulifera TaxID=253017 RepID=UPI001FB0589A|nr:thaumatin-like protein 1 [Impatiens glandulifera]